MKYNGKFNINTTVRWLVPGHGVDADSDLYVIVSSFLFLFSVSPSQYFTKQVGISFLSFRFLPLSPRSVPDVSNI